MIYLAWRNLIQNRTLFLMNVGGIALAMLVMLALEALLAGSEDDLVAYIEKSGADIFVAQEGVRNMHMSGSTMAWRDMSLASYAQGVASVSPILYSTGVVEAGQSDVLSYIIGYDPEEPLGGPDAVVAGVTDLQRDEVIIDEAVARKENLTLGDEVKLLGHTFVIAGITRGFTNIVNSVTFIRLQDYEALRSGNTISYALVKTMPGVDAENVALAIMKRNGDVTALTRTEFSRSERQIIKDMSVELLNFMNAAGFLIGSAVAALTLYTNSMRKRREYGVLKAIGARNWHLYVTVATQAVLSLSIGYGIAVGLVWLMGPLLSAAVPGMGMRLTLEAGMRVLAATLFMGTVAALTPAWQLARLDPAQVFRG